MKIKTIGITLLSLIALNSKIPAQTNENYCLNLEPQKESLDWTNKFPIYVSDYLLTPKKFNPEIGIGFEKEKMDLICSDKTDYRINLDLTLRF